MRAVASILAGLLLAIAPGRAVLADEPVDYVRDIKPILARHCVLCHDAEKPRGDLRVDTAAGALKGGLSGPAIEPGNPDDSILLLAVMGDEFTERMPLNRPPLSDSEIALIHDWIAQGAQAPADEVPSKALSSHWAFVPPGHPEPPEVQDTGWVRNPIDRFILAPLEKDGITPSPEADRATLYRRLSLDLIGLPPSPGEMDAFLQDSSPDAYERLVDRLLDSPHYGERWARQWLDIARYADSNGYSIDAPRSIWKYRDWVINALNRDLPFDQFATEQLAGDLLPNAGLDQLIATGFHRNTPINQEGGIDPEEFRIDSILDRANTTATAFLGLTMGCCQCHDHKFDPVSQEEYYQFFAFFNNCDEPEIPTTTPEEAALRQKVEARAEAYLTNLWESEPDIQKQANAWEQGLDKAARGKLPKNVREALAVPLADREPATDHVVFAAFIDQAPAAKKHKEALARIRAEAPPVVTTMIVRERSQIRETHVLTQGDFTRPAQVVGPGVPSVLPPLKARGDRPDRLDLAHWLFQPEHPLTARVTVNRIWQAHFGRGLVETENDFGTQGTPPTHPELLDWLATEFIARGWSLKAIHRLIVTSATYRQSSNARPDLATIDPRNLRLARQSRVRLSAEAIRDSSLTASGLLARAVGGPSVFPPQPDGVMNLGQMRREWKADTGFDRYRRGLYTYFWRATPHPMLTVFDAPDATQACTRRERSNTPLQALTLLNDAAYYECAQALADRLLRGDSHDRESRLTEAFRLCLVREPTDAELNRLGALIDQIRGEPGVSDREVWTSVARVLLNLDEFITRE